MYVCGPSEEQEILSFNQLPGVNAHGVVYDEQNNSNPSEHEHGKRQKIDFYNKMVYVCLCMSMYVYVCM